MRQVERSRRDDVKRVPRCGYESEAREEGNRRTGDENTGVPTREFENDRVYENSERDTSVKPSTDDGENGRRNGLQDENKYDAICRWCSSGLTNIGWILSDKRV